MSFWGTDFLFLGEIFVFLRSVKCACSTFHIAESLAVIASWEHPDCVRFLDGLKNLENLTLFTVKSAFQILLTSFHCSCNGKNLKALWERKKILQNLRGNEYTLLGTCFILLDVHCVNKGIFWEFFFFFLNRTITLTLVTDIGHSSG